MAKLRVVDLESEEGNICKLFLLGKINRAVSAEGENFQVMKSDLGSYHFLHGRGEEEVVVKIAPEQENCFTFSLISSFKNGDKIKEKVSQNVGCNPVTIFMGEGFFSFTWPNVVMLGC